LHPFSCKILWSMLCYLNLSFQFSHNVILTVLGTSIMFRYLYVWDMRCCLDAGAIGVPEIYRTCSGLQDWRTGLTTRNLTRCSVLGNGKNMSGEGLHLFNWFYLLPRVVGYVVSSFLPNSTITNIRTSRSGQIIQKSTCTTRTSKEDMCFVYRSSDSPP